MKTTGFQRVYTEPIQPLNPTVYVKAISFSGLCATSTGSGFDQARVRRLSSPTGGPHKQCVCLCSKYKKMYGRILKSLNIETYIEKSLS